jgi:NO-binding membrane sensor protein with MHYT domain
VKILKQNKYELYISFFVVVIGFLLTAHRPHNYKDVLVASSTLLVGLLCAFNALLDMKRMNWLERSLAVPWFLILLVLTPFTIWDVAHIGMFADR